MLVNKTVEFFLSEAAGWTVSGSGLGAGDLRCQAAVPATKSHGQAADSERPGTGRDTGGDRGLGRVKMPAGAKAGTGRDAEDQINSKESAL